MLFMLSFYMYMYIYEGKLGKQVDIYVGAHRIPC